MACFLFYSKLHYQTLCSGRPYLAADVLEYVLPTDYCSRETLQKCCQACLEGRGNISSLLASRLMSNVLTECKMYHSCSSKFWPNHACSTTLSFIHQQPIAKLTFLRLLRDARYQQQTSLSSLRRDQLGMTKKWTTRCPYPIVASYPYSSDI